MSKEVLTPPGDQVDVDHPAGPSPLSEPRQSTRPFGPIRRIFLFTFLIFTFQISIIVGFIAYIWSHKTFQDRSNIWVDVPNNMILLFSTIVSRISPLLVSPVMGFAAYGYAREWLVSSAVRNQDIPAAPTPEQYDIALRVLGSANIAALFAGGKYLFRRYRQLTTAIAPFWLTKSILFLSLTLGLASLIGGIDLWLHQAVQTVHMTTFTTSTTPTTDFSRILNSTLCDTYYSEYNFTRCYSVELDANMGPPTIIGEEEALRTLSNASTIHEVLVIQNSSVAILLPAAELRSTLTYQATTLGIYTTCAPVSVECGLTPGGDGQFVCQEHPAFFPPAFEDVTSLPLDTSSRHTFVDSGTRLINQSDVGHFSEIYIGALSQPVEFGVSTIFQDIPTLSDPQIVPLLDGYAVRIVLWCEMSILNVTYLYGPHLAGQVQILNYTLASANDTSAISGPIYNGLGTQYIDAVTIPTIVNVNATVYGNSYAQQMSRVALALGAGMIMPSKTLVEYPSHSILRGSQIPLAALIVFILVLLLFSLSILATVGFSGTATGPIMKDGRNRDTHGVKLAHARLTSHAPLIYETFCADDLKLRRAGYQDPAELLVEGDGLEYTDKDRIRVGVLSDSESPDGHFSISTNLMRDVRSLGGVVVL